MKVKIKGYLTYKNSIGEQVLELTDGEGITLQDLLVRLSLESGLGDALYHAEAGTVDRMAVVLVNGRHHSHLPDRLDTILIEGDEVAIFPPLAGG